MSKMQDFAESKAKLLTVIVISVIGSLSIPILLPHINHGFHVYHLLLHTSGIIFAVFLTILGINAYYKMRTKKLAITTVAFFVFAVAEMVALFDATAVHHFEMTTAEIAHIMMIAMIGLFAWGVFRDD